MKAAELLPRQRRAILLNHKLWRSLRFETIMRLLFALAISPWPSLTLANYPSHLDCRR
jgi:hypothetical protein